MNIKGFFIYIICLKIEYPCLYKKKLSKKLMIMKCIHKYKNNITQQPNITPLK